MVTKITKEQIKNDPKIIEWLTNINAARSTADHYINWMHIFCDCNDRTPSQLIAEAIKGIKKGLLPAERNEGVYISKFKTCLKKVGYAESSFHHAIAGVKSFYGSFDIPLPKTAGRLKMAHPLQMNQNFLVKDDIRKLVTNARNIRERAIILCMASSGMAMTEICNLQMSMLKFDENGIGTITHRRQKTGTDYVTFISPEAGKMLKVYFDERNRVPETKIQGDNDYVFVSDAANSQGKQLTPVTEVCQLRRLGERIGYKAEAFTKAGRRGMIKTRSHAFRKYFASTLENAGMSKSKIEFMLGHFRSGSDIAYFNVDVSLLKKMYVEFLPYLTFSEEMTITKNVIDDERLIALEKEKQQQKKQIETLQKELEERKRGEVVGLNFIIEMREKMKELEARVEAKK